MVIAAPDHWHAPASLMALKAGKHVYVEKPCSHNPNEGEILVKAANYYGKVVQMGNQRRSWPNVVKGINAIKSITVPSICLQSIASFPGRARPHILKLEHRLPLSV